MQGNSFPNADWSRLKDSECELSGRLKLGRTASTSYGQSLGEVHMDQRDQTFRFSTEKSDGHIFTPIEVDMICCQLEGIYSTSSMFLEAERS
jgi:hypothetical protein